MLCLGQLRLIEFELSQIHFILRLVNLKLKTSRLGSKVDPSRRVKDWV